MEDFENWADLMRDIPFLIRFLTIAFVVGTLAIIGTLVAVAVQLGRLVDVAREQKRLAPATSSYPYPVQQPSAGQPPTYGPWGPPSS